MYIPSGASDELLLGPSNVRKRVLSPSILLSPQARRLASMGTTLIAIAAVAALSLFMLTSDFAPGLPPLSESASAAYLSSNATDELSALSSRSSLGAVAPAIVYGISILGGVMLGIFGYRFVRAGFFAAGFTVGLVVFFDIGTQAFQGESWVVAGSLVLSIVGAILVALLALYLYRFGIAAMGVLAGIGFGAFLGSIFFIQLNAARPEIPMFISMASFGVLLGLVAFFEEKPVVILCTSFLGSFFIVLGAGNFIGQYPTPANIQSLLLALRNGAGDAKVAMPGAWWAYFAATLLLWMVCIVVQVQYTANGVDHDAEAVEKAAGHRRPPRPVVGKEEVPIDIKDVDTAKTKATKGSFKVERGI
ncbi:hypothetical protein H310_11169 [Aphanomyces invadans]|uniref:Transmembrane protein 198 n=1 Tax=Aphanomyces invadans TaxID=157072 RepID=A0A024TM82_9STRA|nr:hypothetical protein H310_11169 [Aphanomyces invadans]ETV95265.1 hypothetical protein H310_11169 [Aphanomyces invadans]|eukprot:XP_008875966.1 hypothetical protein H310_11169 [Aphanomyces invadans]